MSNNDNKTLKNTALDEKLSGQYDFNTSEGMILEKWESNNLYKSEDIDLTKYNRDDYWILVCPPPNAYDKPHLGNLSGYVYMDMMARFQRMKGKKVILLPGKDHAGLEGEAVYIRDTLTPLGKKKTDFTRSEFYNLVFNRQTEFREIIQKNEKITGLSADFTKDLYTLDPAVVNNVLDTFIDAYNSGIIYKGTRIVNWDTIAQSTISDSQCEREERDGKLYFIKYELSNNYILPTREEVDENSKNYNNDRHNRMKGILFEFAKFANANNIKYILSGDWACIINAGYEYRQCENLYIYIYEESKETSDKFFIKNNYVLSNKYQNNSIYFYQLSLDDTPIDIHIIGKRNENLVSLEDENDIIGKIICKKYEGVEINILAPEALMQNKINDGKDLRWKEVSDFIIFGRFDLITDTWKNKLNYITVATTRPETIFADTAIAVNPEDVRFKHLIGQKVKLPSLDKKIPIISSKRVDIEFGTGVLKITPAHSQDDFVIMEEWNKEVSNLNQTYFKDTKYSELLFSIDPTINTNLIFRKANINDLKDILTIKLNERRKKYIEDYKLNETELKELNLDTNSLERRFDIDKELFKKIDDVSSQCYVAVLDEKIIGFVWPQIDQHNLKRIGDIYVDSNYQSKGIGKILLNIAYRFHNDDVHLIVRESNTKAIHFYLSNGFEIIKTYFESKVEESLGIKRCLMRKDTAKISYINCIDKYANLTGSAPQKYLGKKAKLVKEEFVNELSELGYIFKIEDVKQNILKSERTGAIIEPMMSSQWFIKVDNLKEKLKDLINSQQLILHPHDAQNKLFAWIDNLKDWAISRSLWWGYRLPVWYNGQIREIIDNNGKVQVEICTKINSEKIILIDALKTIIYADDKYNIDSFHLNSELVEYLNKLPNKKIVLTNASGEKLDKIKEMLKPFDYEIFTLNANPKKSEGEYFNILMNKYELDLKNVIYFDHNSENLQAAKSKDIEIIYQYEHNNRNLINWLNTQVYKWEIMNMNDRNQVKVQLEKPDGENWIQDEEVLDTWFSSGQWPYIQLNHWNMMSMYPIDCLMSAGDLLIKWDLIMMIMSLIKGLGTPFKNLYLTGLVLAKDGSKMSKSKKNGMDIEEIKEKYGIDSFRMNCVFKVAPFSNYIIKDETLKGFRNFNNKVWNAGKFVIQTSGTNLLNFDKSEIKLDVNIEMLKNIESLKKRYIEMMDNYKFWIIIEEIYLNFWNDFCDKYIENTKKFCGEFTDGQYKKFENQDADETRYVLQYVYKEYLKILHPFVPFVTERIWGEFEKNIVNNESELLTFTKL